MKNAIADLVADLSESNDQETWQAATQFFSTYGFDIANMGVVDKSNGELLGMYSNMRDSWLEYYMASGYALDDPWVHYILDNKDPILYSLMGESEFKIQKNTTGEKMIREAADEGLHVSLCIPIHNDLDSRMAGFNLASDMADKDFKAMLVEHKQDILLGAALINNYICEKPTMKENVEAWRVNPDYKSLLSEREIEVLKWLSEGHRNDRIAERMDIASVTVNYHLKEIKRKLGAKTREQSVALAFKKGFLR